MPEIEEREAAIFSGYTWREWLGLPCEDRIDGIAHFRLHLYIKLHRQDAVERHNERVSRRGGKRG